MSNQNHIKEKKETLTFKVDAETANYFRDLVKKEGLTMSQALRTYVERYVGFKGSLVTVDDSNTK